jgi:hypothetical protein
MSWFYIIYGVSALLAALIILGICWYDARRTGLVITLQGLVIAILGIFVPVFNTFVVIGLLFYLVKEEFKGVVLYDSRKRK